ncbi:MAG: ABC transporter permease [Microbacteriaceae bacterium]
MADTAAAETRRPVLRTLWQKVWPPLLAIVIVLVLWQILAASGWKPAYVFPGPEAVAENLGEQLTTPKFWKAVAVTMTRAIAGFAIAGVVGTVLGLLVSRSRVLRTAVGSLITGLQTMPSIAWFPFAILLFGLSEQSIAFVILIGAAPSIANGVISGVDDVPPALIKTAHTLGARGVTMYARVIVPAALPSYLAGLKQGWAFAWRSLMAGELLVNIANRPSIGAQLSYFRDFANAAGLMGMMIVILVLGILVDRVFGTIMTSVRARRGLGEVRL